MLGIKKEGSQEPSPRSRKTIKGWALNLAWSDGTEEILIDVPDDVADNIDNYLTEYESKKYVDTITDRLTE